MADYPQNVGPVVVPSDPGYERARHIWNDRFDCRPRAVMYPRNTAETAAAVGYVREHGVPFRIRSGGHNSEGFCTVDDGIIIDLSKLGGVAVNDDRTRAVISPGVLLGELYESLWSVGGTIPAGVCPDIRIGGHVLGGGIGMLVRSRGLLIDSLVGLTVVDAQGESLRVDDESHPDLLWACRGGGGGNYGIATSYTFEMKPVSEVTLYRLEWDWEGGISVLDAWQQWILLADSRVNSRFNLFPRSAGTVLTTGLFEGSADELKSILQPLTDRHPPRDTSLRTMPFMESVGLFSEQVPSIRAKFVPALSAGPLDAPALKVLERRHRDAPAGVKTGFYGLGGAVLGSVPADQSAFAHRDASLCVEYLGHWHGAENDSEHLDWLAGTREEMDCFMTGGAYVNSPDRDLDNWLHAYYGDNLPRLMEVKRRYDPADLFSFEQSIPASLTLPEARAAGLTEPVISELRTKGLLSA
ncbi:FAD-binding oxidoreductase [Streptomyces sp. N2-109]|uniref:FAD-binding oxidoreductase n=1 Tax=Streptomyces gossypii TaxID=2883101 RepID=A0ABT2JMP4_9ACTN|nr:FAD-binding oxidoreductase [Streptomyces gossypii]MCT2589152.1 FAD-binding oxidoreductase [Streptomyces gossypii]